MLIINFGEEIVRANIRNMLELSMVIPLTVTVAVADDCDDETVTSHV